MCWPVGRSTTGGMPTPSSGRGPISRCGCGSLSILVDFLALLMARATRVVFMVVEHRYHFTCRQIPDPYRIVVESSNGQAFAIWRKAQGVGTAPPPVSERQRLELSGGFPTAEVPEPYFLVITARNQGV